MVSREGGGFRFREVNPAFETASGMRRAQLLGRRPTETLPAPAGVEIEAMLQRCMLGSGSVAFDIGFDRPGERRYWAVSLAALPGDALASATVIGSARDVTEARLQQDALMQAQKMEAVGQMTGGIAHDFNNLLTVIAGNLDLVEMRLARSGMKPDEGITRTIASAQRAAERAERLTQQLLAFSRKQPLQPSAIDLNALIDEAQDLLARSVGETVAIVKVKQPNLPICTADPHQLELALLNLALNSRDAMPEGGALTIATAYRSLRPAEAKRLDLSPGDYVTLAVSDTGTGMPPEVAAHAFDPFFTTKDAGRGSGLGLSMVYGFAKQSRGHVALASTVGRGTTVTLYLPCQIDRRADEEPAVAPDAVAPGCGGETVLVVEDDVEVLKYASSVLEELGYRVLSAENGTSALDRLDSEHVDALFTDVVMAGGMSGFELARIAKERQPGLKVLFATGYAAEFAQQDSTVEPLRVLHKPYKRLPLAQEIRQLLTAAEGAVPGAAHFNPRLSPASGPMPITALKIYFVFLLTYAGMAAGRLPWLRVDRTGIALLGLIALLGSQALTLDEIGARIDMPTLMLLFALMIISAQFVTSGFCDAVFSRLGTTPGSPLRILGLTVAISGGLAAFLATTSWSSSRRRS